jgi:MFS transporter, ACS family, glucarate transporter
MSQSANDSPSIDSARPTIVRYKVVALAVLLGMITYLDRVCISNLAPHIRSDLDLTEFQMSWVFSAFTIAYALFEIPTGRLADRFGTRNVLTRIVLWWSAFTVATAGAFNYVSLLTTRFLFGAGEAGAWPSVASTFSRWITAKQRGTMQSFFFAGAFLSGGLTPVLVTFLADKNLRVLATNKAPWIGPLVEPFLTPAGSVSWRVIFILFGLVGFAWAITWKLWYRDDPSLHQGVNKAEHDLIVSGRSIATAHHASRSDWGRLFSHRNTWLLCLMYIGNTSAYFFCISWFPTYLKERHGLEETELGLASGLPLTLAVAGSLLGGFSTDYLTRRFGHKIGRTVFGALAYCAAAVTMLLAAASTTVVTSLFSLGSGEISPETAANMPYISAWVTVVGFALTVAAVDSTLGAAWGTCLDIGGHNTGIVSATMNSAGAFFGIFVPPLATFLKGSFNTWDAPLFMLFGILLIGVVCWLLIDPRKKVFE